MKKILLIIVMLACIAGYGQTGATRGGGGTGATTYLPKGDTTGELFYWDNTNKRMVAAFGNKLKWDATNSRLGIGTDAPTTALQVNGTIQGNSECKGFTNVQATIYYPGTSSSDLQLSTLAGNNKSILFKPNNSEVARFTYTGYLGIGTTSPTTKLQVKDGALRMGVTAYTEIDSTAVKAKAFTVTTTDTTSVGYSVGSIQMRITASDTSCWLLIRTTGSITARWKKLTP